MPRPAFTLEVDDATPPIPFWRNSHLTTEKLPNGSFVSYPPEPLTPLVDLRANVKASVESPVDGNALSNRLQPGMRFTIAFDDLSATNRLLASPDPRTVAIEEILTIAAAAGIDDVELINARGLARRMTKGELSAMLGPRITDSFIVTNLLTQHDADDEDNLMTIGDAKSEKQIKLNRRVAESDLLVYVSVDPSHSSPYRNIAARLTGAETAQSVIATSSAGAIDYIGEALERQTEIFQVAITLNNAEFSSSTAFLQSRVNEWSFTDKLAFRAIRTALDATPNPIRERLLHVPPSRQGVVSVVAGSVTATNAASQAVLQKQYGAEESGPGDVLVVGAPPASPYAINSILNPLLAAHFAMTTAVPVDGRSPLVRQGGALILHHGLTKTFDPQEQPSFIDFYDSILPVEPGDDLTKAEETFANDAWYRHLYRTSYAHHGTLPFRLWAECDQARAHLGGIIVVGGDIDAAHRLGFRRASTFADAIEMACDITAEPKPAITALPFPAPRSRAKS